jgi:hypothetical protein
MTIKLLNAEMGSWNEFILAMSMLMWQSVSVAMSKTVSVAMSKMC